MTSPLDWLSRLLNMMSVHGRLEVRCSYGAPWQVVYEDAHPGEIPYHVVLRGAAVLETPGAGAPQQLAAGDIVLIPHGAAHRLHDGSGAAPAPAQRHAELNLTISENTGGGERLDMLCGRFVLAPPHDRFIRNYLPKRLVVRTAAADAAGSAAQLAGLVALMRAEAHAGQLGGYAMMNAFSAALFALTLRIGSEAGDAPVGMLALAGHPRLAPALNAMFDQPAHPWTLPALAELCNMSRATLIRHFHDSVGRTATELLTDLRMTLAANALRQPGMSTDAVAESVGYQSVAAFRRAFTQYSGMPPGAWRSALINTSD